MLTVITITFDEVGLVFLLGFEEQQLIVGDFNVVDIWQHLLLCT